MNFYSEDAEAVLEYFSSGAEGLPPEEAAARLIENGKNELMKAKGKSLVKRFAEQLVNPMILILLAAAAVSIAIVAFGGGDPHEYAEAGVILAVVILNGILGVFQESKADRAIEALRKMSAATAKARRGGSVVTIPASELTVGDVVLIEAGDAVPADMRLIQCASLRIEEAALTGESVPVEKQTKAIFNSESGAVEVPLGDRANMAYSGSTVVYGRGEGVVTATGMFTETGKIAGIIQNTAEGQTPLQKNLSKLGKTLSVLVLGVCAVIFAIRLLTTETHDAKSTVDGFMLAVSLAVAAIPEGLAAVVTIVLSIGVTNMAKRNAIVRKLTAVETLGCAQVICSDKTGTLTQNKMTVVDTYGDAKFLAGAMALCCDSHLNPDGTITGDPTENALITFALKEGIDLKSLAANNPRVAEAPFDSARKMMSTVHKTRDGIIQYTKGAPDEVLARCSYALTDGRIVMMDKSVLGAITEKNGEFADGALRVLACAYKKIDRVPEHIAPEKTETNLTFIGLAAMIDPVRPEAKAAVESCARSGITAVMITGDHRETAAAIAMELGMITDPAQAITGAELDGLDDEEFADRIEGIFVYARVRPEHKVRIVNAWKQKGYVTAMTGDGVNDAPALKSGDIGIGMGITGTDAAKNVADMVLADDNFATIVSAVEEGRRIYDNIKKTVQFLLSSNLSEVTSIFIATVAGFVLFKPIHLLFINLVTDSLPAIALGMERAQPGIMERPPRGMKEGVFSDGLGIELAYQGVLIAALTLAAYFIVDIWHGHDYAMTSAFFTISMCEIFHSFNMRSQKQSIFILTKHNAYLWAATAAALAMTLAVIYIPPLSGTFSLAPLTPPEFATSLGLSLMIIPLVETVKIIRRAFEKKVEKP